MTGPRPADAPQGRRGDDGRLFAAALLGVGGLMAVVLLFGVSLLGPLPSAGEIATPSGAARAVEPTPDTLARLVLAAQATWYAPTPARPTAAPRPTSTPVEVVLCGVNAAAGEVCRWPEPPAPTPTAVPGCGTPLPGAVCVWGGGR